MAINSETFTESERNSLIAEIILQEGPKIDSVIGLFGHLNREKERVLELLVSSDDQDFRTTLWEQLGEIKTDLTWTEDYINNHINGN